MHRFPALCLLLLLPALLPPVQAEPPARYQLLDLGTLGGKNCHAFALNDRAQVVGSSQTAAGVYHAFLWEKGRMRDLGTLPSDGSSAALAINEKGQAVGVSDNNDRPQYGVPFNDSFARPVAWNDGVIRKLPADDSGAATGINDAGYIIETISDTGTSTAFLLKGETRADLGSFGGGYSQATAINGRGEVVGTSFTVRGKSGNIFNHGFLWVNGRMRNLGLPDVTGVNALNGHEQIVGMACVNPSLPSRKQHLEAFLWKKGKTHFLGRLPGSRGNSAARGINDRSQIVGWSHTKAGDSQAVLWQDGKMVNLNQRAQVPAGWTLDGAEMVNNRGQILCRGYTITVHLKSHSYVIISGGGIPGEVRHSFLLTPAPASWPPQSPHS